MYTWDLWQSVTTSRLVVGAQCNGCGAQIKKKVHWREGRGGQGRWSEGDLYLHISTMVMTNWGIALWLPFNKSHSYLIRGGWCWLSGFGNNWRGGRKVIASSIALISISRSKDQVDPYWFQNGWSNSQLDISDHLLPTPSNQCNHYSLLARLSWQLGVRLAVCWCRAVLWF